MAISQAVLFLIFNLNGIIIGLLFDFFRIMRKSFKTTNFITYIEDITFWLLTGFSIFIFMYKFAEGNIRLFMFLGLIFGIIFYMVTFSKSVINFFVYIILYLKKIITKVIGKIMFPLKYIKKIKKM